MTARTSQAKSILDACEHLRDRFLLPSFSIPDLVPGGCVAEPESLLVRTGFAILMPPGGRRRGPRDLRGRRKAYNHKYDPTSTIATVLQDAMTFFKIHTDGTTRYFIMAGGDEQEPGTTGAEAGPGHSRSIKLSLRTETISGNA